MLEDLKNIKDTPLDLLKLIISFLSENNKDVANFLRTCKRLSQYKIFRAKISNSFKIIGINIDNAEGFINTMPLISTPGQLTDDKKQVLNVTNQLVEKKMIDVNMKNTKNCMLITVFIIFYTCASIMALSGVASITLLFINDGYTPPPYNDTITILNDTSVDHTLDKVMYVINNYVLAISFSITMFLGVGVACQQGKKYYIAGVCGIMYLGLFRFIKEDLGLSLTLLLPIFTLLLSLCVKRSYVECKERFFTPLSESDEFKDNMRIINKQIIDGVKLKEPLIANDELSSNC